MVSSERIVPIANADQSRVALGSHFLWPYLPAGLSILAILAFSWRTAASLVATWLASRTYSFGFLILPMFLYLVWLRKDRLNGLRLKPAVAVIPLVAAAGVAWFLGYAGDVLVVQQFALVGMLVATLWALLGWDLVRTLRFPLLVLIFAVPFGTGIIGPLQDITAHFAVFCLKLSGIPVLLESRTIVVPSGVWVIAEACSGIRYLIACIVLGLVYASLIYRSRRRIAVFVAASVIVPILANGLRAYGIILLGYLSNNRLAVGVDHIIYGWIFFTFVQLLLFSVGLRWRELDLAEQQTAVQPPADPENPSSDGYPRLKWVLLACACVLVAAVPQQVAARYLNNRDQQGQFKRLAVVVGEPWQRIRSNGGTWAPELKPTAQLTESYFSGSKHVDLYMGSYSGPDRVQFLDDSNRVSEPARWMMTALGSRKESISGREVMVSYHVLRSDLQSRVVWTWYWSNGRPTGSPTEVKLLQTEARLRSRSNLSAVIAVSAPFQLDPAEAESPLQNFVHHLAVSY